jgi:hypothetical protein
LLLFLRPATPSPQAARLVGLKFEMIQGASEDYLSVLEAQKK